MDVQFQANLKFDFHIIGIKSDKAKPPNALLSKKYDVETIINV